MTRELVFIVCELWDSLRYYIDDGFVTDMAQHRDEIHKRYRTLNISDNHKNVSGECLKIVAGKNIYHYIFYLDQKSKARNIHTRAHEETHALDDMGKLELLTTALDKNQGVKINLKYYDPEIRAEIGAIYALREQGISLWNLFFDFNSTVLKAGKIYRKHIVKKMNEKRFCLF